MPTAIEQHRKNRELVNITLPARLLRRVDEAAHQSNESRPGLLARAAIEAIRRSGGMQSH
jgi:metal-responsive CopG/Arc/MetJ family transcriptional regulator